MSKKLRAELAIDFLASAPENDPIDVALINYFKRKAGSASMEKAENDELALARIQKMVVANAQEEGLFSARRRQRSSWRPFAAGAAAMGLSLLALLLVFHQGLIQETPIPWQFTDPVANFPEPAHQVELVRIALSKDDSESLHAIVVQLSKVALVHSEVDRHGAIVALAVFVDKSSVSAVNEILHPFETEINHPGYVRFLFPKDDKEP